MMSVSSKRGLRAIRSALLVAASAPLVFAAAASAETAATDGSVRFGSWGVDLSSRDSKANPGDDFERFASGAWMDATEIPADKPSNSVGSEVNDRNQDRLQKIVTSSSKDSQLGALYGSWMDEARLEQLDAAPLQADLDEISAIKTKAQFTSKMVDSFSDFGSTLFALGVLPDPANPTINIAFAGTSGMGLPDRDYYLLDKYKPQRDAYRAYIQRTLELTQTPNASAAADTILAFETEIAKLSWTQADLRNLDKLNNPMTPAELAAYAPGIDWNRYLAELKINTPKIVVGDNTAVKALAALYEKTPLETLKLWQRFKVTNQASDYLSKRFVDKKFQFTKTLTGASTLRPRWRRGIDQIDGRLGEVLGQTYVQQYFSPQSKAMMEQLVTNLKAAAAIRIKGNSWMEDATKQAALAKLDRMDVMVGYPDKFRDYSKLEMKADDLYGNVKRSSAFEWDYTLSDLNQPVDRKKWAMSPATVNAYNGGLENKIVFPAGILQPPYFDPQADAAVNYGAIGAVIGHESMHGFDDQGRKIDASGAIRDWWTPADGERFKKLTDELGRQYASYEAAPGVFINPDLTMGENIGDMSGLEVAYEAYKISLGGKPSPVIDGLTGDQRFFLAFAQAWRGEQRDDAIKTQVASDPHSPRRYRVIGPLRNLDAWYSAFNVQPGTKFYIPPEKRVRIW